MLPEQLPQMASMIRIVVPLWEERRICKTACVIFGRMLSNTPMRGGVHFSVCRRSK